MSRILASVTDIEEALIAVECGVDIVDLKNPAAGALGALPLSTVRGIVDEIAFRKPVSATIGDLPMHPEAVVSAASEMASTGVDIVKIGFFGHGGHRECIDALQLLTNQEIRLVAVLFADDEPDLKLVPRLAEAGFHGVMLDTAYKNGQRLQHHMDDAVLKCFVTQSREHGLITGLAGSLSIDDLPGLLHLQADYLGFRGALCEGASRVSRIERERLVHLRKVLHSCNSLPAETVG